jgi:hypothetical protein
MMKNYVQYHNATKQGAVKPDRILRCGAARLLHFCTAVSDNGLLAGRCESLT